MRVFIPTLLRSYTGGASVVSSHGDHVDAVLRDLDRRFPGLRFRIIDEQDRIRPHMKIFVNQDQVRGLEAAVADDDEVHILQALSGG